mmetsp:Transcript_27781/g.65289  ORF Transcript_27781/g.65289 Transcript_27781/m.65289 type:complete len:261 (-) Transcript_27781:278-1060(-)
MLSADRLHLLQKALGALGGFQAPVSRRARRHGAIVAFAQRDEPFVLSFFVQRPEGVQVGPAPHRCSVYGGRGCPHFDDEVDVLRRRQQRRVGVGLFSKLEHRLYYRVGPTEILLGTIVGVVVVHCQSGGRCRIGSYVYPLLPQARVSIGKAPEESDAAGFPISIRWELLQDRDGLAVLAGFAQARDFRFETALGRWRRRRRRRGTEGTERTPGKPPVRRRRQNAGHHVLPAVREIPTRSSITPLFGPRYPNVVRLAAIGR